MYVVSYDNGERYNEDHHNYVVYMSISAKDIITWIDNNPADTLEPNAGYFVETLDDDNKVVTIPLETLKEISKL